MILNPKKINFNVINGIELIYSHINIIRVRESFFKYHLMVINNINIHKNYLKFGFFFNVYSSLYCPGTEESNCKSFDELVRLNNISLKIIWKFYGIIKCNWAIKMTRLMRTSIQTNFQQSTTFLGMVSYVFYNNSQELRCSWNEHQHQQHSWNGYVLYISMNILLFEYENNLKKMNASKRVEIILRRIILP